MADLLVLDGGPLADPSSSIPGGNVLGDGYGRASGAAQIVGVFGSLRRGDQDQRTDVAEVLTGREPRGFAQFARHHAQVFGARSEVPIGQEAGRR